VIPRRQISILAGASGSGKTTLLLQAIQAWQRDQPFPLRFNAKNCAYLVADRTGTEVRDRAEALGVDIELYGLVDDRKFKKELLNDPDRALDVALQQFRKPYDLLILDPIMLFIKGNALDYRAVAVALVGLNRLAVDKNMTIIATHHASKARSDFSFMRPQDRILGSAAFQGFSGTQMILVEPEEGKTDCHVFVSVSHTAAKEVTYLERNSEGWFIPADKVGVPLVQAMQEGVPVNIKELRETAEKQRMSPATLYRCLASCIKDGLVMKVGHGLYMRVKCQ
jgi:RecA/RadA recombinase